jgi:hypothetical protein
VTSPKLNLAWNDCVPLCTVNCLARPSLP